MPPRRPGREGPEGHRRDGAAELGEDLSARAPPEPLDRRRTGEQYESRDAEVASLGGAKRAARNRSVDDDVANREPSTPEGAREAGTGPVRTEPEQRPVVAAEPAGEALPAERLAPEDGPDPYGP